MTDDEQSVGALRAEVAALRARVGELEESEARIRGELRESQRIVERIPVLLYIYDVAQRKMTYANRDLTDLLGYSPEEAAEIGPDILGALAHPEDREALFSRHLPRMASTNAGEIVDITYRMRDARGEERWLNSRHTVLEFGPDNMPRKILGTVKDITDLKQAEREIARITEAMQQSADEREALQAKLIEAQREALREIGTPLIPIADGVVAMPLIGVIDQDRAKRMLEVLLDGITAQRALAAILDITGVKTVNTTVADVLVRAARSARLLGAEVVLTGVGPGLAQALVEAGADLGGVVVRGTFQGGIAYALGLVE
jgi:rsbT co-antagonist protein RsbR